MKLNKLSDNYDIHCFLLPVTENTPHINFDIIPQSQINDISKYHQQNDRNKRFIARSFLFEYCQKHFNLQQFDFIYQEHLRPRYKYSETKFSFSYSGEYILIGISSQKEIGVDIEQIDSDLEVKKIASEIMHEDELVYFSSLRNIDRLDYFYQLWSGKESLIKAFGKGFYYPVTKIKLMANKMGIVKYEDNQFQYFLSDEIVNYALAVSYEK